MGSGIDACCEMGTVMGYKYETFSRTLASYTYLPVLTPSPTHHQTMSDQITAQGDQAALDKLNFTGKSPLTLSDGYLISRWLPNF